MGSTLAAVIEEQPAPASVRGSWGNGFLAVVLVLLPAEAIALTVRAALSIASPVLRVGLIAAAVGVGVGVGLLLAVRCIQLGVYARPEGLVVRGLTHSRTYLWAVTIGTTVRTRTNGKGGTYYLPTLVVRQHDRIDPLQLVVLPLEQQPTEDWFIALNWLATATEQKAQRRARQVQSMIDATRHQRPDLV